MSLSPGATETCTRLDSARGDCPTAALLTCSAVCTCTLAFAVPFFLALTCSLVHRRFELRPVCSTRCTPRGV
eukprot:9838649-Alexandrium_andersonii.AAC.1